MHSSLFNICLMKINMVYLRVDESSNDMSFRVKISDSTLCARPASLTPRCRTQLTHAVPQDDRQMRGVLRLNQTQRRRTEQQHNPTQHPHHVIQHPCLKMTGPLSDAHFESLLVVLCGKFAS